ELVLEPLAASYAVLTDDEKELGFALVEVGGGSTGVAIFHEGKIRHLASLKYAGTHVERPGGGVGGDAGGCGAAQGASWGGVSTARGRVGDDQPAVYAEPGGAAGIARAAVAHHPPAGGRDLPAGAARVRAGGVRGRTAAGRGGADGRDGAPAGDGGAGARRVRGSGAGRDAGAGDLGARRQRAGAALCSTGGPGVVRGAATRAGRRSQRLVGQECGRRAVVRTAEAVVA